MKDSLKRISKLSNEVALVKMADRIDNLSSLNPIWDKDRALWYVEQSLIIADMLQTKCPAMSLKLIDSIFCYHSKQQKQFHKKKKNLNFYKKHFLLIKMEMLMKMKLDYVLQMQIQWHNLFKKI